MSDSESSGNEVSQGALRHVPFSAEDAYFADQEKATLELLKRERQKRFEEERFCLQPSCENQKMDRVEIDKVEIDKCPKCGGIWLDPGELDLLLKRSKGSKTGLMKFFHELAGRYDD